MQDGEDLSDVPIDTITGYRTVLADLWQHDHALPLRDMINRLLSRAHLSQTAGPHMGLATEVYTNFTSPLRKALDFYVHLQISACLAGGPECALSGRPTSGDHTIIGSITSRH